MWSITAPGTGHELVEQALARQGFERRVALSLPTLPGVGNLLANTDLVATVPERVAQMLVRIAQREGAAAAVQVPDLLDQAALARALPAGSGQPVVAVDGRGSLSRGLKEGRDEMSGPPNQLTTVNAAPSHCCASGRALDPAVV